MILKDYIKPEIEITGVMFEEDILTASKWNVHDPSGQGQGTPGDPENPLDIIKDEDPEGGIFSKDGSNMWDGWDD